MCRMKVIADPRKVDASPRALMRGFADILSRRHHADTDSRRTPRPGPWACDCGRRVATDRAIDPEPQRHALAVRGASHAGNQSVRKKGSGVFFRYEMSEKKTPDPFFRLRHGLPAARPGFHHGLLALADVHDRVDRVGPNTVRGCCPFHCVSASGIPSQWRLRSVTTDAFGVIEKSCSRTSRRHQGTPRRRQCAWHPGSGWLRSTTQ
jgi:hypothetical protein